MSFASKERMCVVSCEQGPFGVPMPWAGSSSYLCKPAAIPNLAFVAV